MCSATKPEGAGRTGWGIWVPGSRVAVDGAPQPRAVSRPRAVSTALRPHPEAALLCVVCPGCEWPRLRSLSCRCRVLQGRCRPGRGSRSSPGSWPLPPTPWRLGSQGGYTSRLLVFPWPLCPSGSFGETDPAGVWTRVSRGRLVMGSQRWGRPRTCVCELGRGARGEARGRPSGRGLDLGGWSWGTRSRSLT